MKRWFFGTIVLIALILRLVDLSNHPVGFTPDEASFGYDAYSLIKTGEDQWGNKWPLSFKSFGDYKLPLYGYLAAPSVALFGLSEFAVRLPNALIGVGAVVVTYFLVKKTKLGSPELAALLLAVSPWHVPMSRGAFEANLTTLLMPLGVLVFLKAKESPKYYYLAALAFGLNLFSYHSARLVTPIVVLALIFQQRKTFVKKALGPALLFGVFAVVALVTMFTGSGGRLATSSLISPQGYGATFNDRFESVLSGASPAIATVFNNKLVYVVNEFFQKYISYFSPTFFWSEGPAEATYGMMPGFGVLHWFETLFLVGFILWLVAKRLTKDNLWLVVWLVAAPIPAALSIGPGFAANRAVVMLPALHVASAIGAYYFYGLIKRRSVKRIGLALGSIALTLSTAFFVEEYFFQQPVTGASAMMYGVRDTIGSIRDVDGEILVSKKLSEPHIFVAFYNKLDPRVVQVASNEWNFEDQGFAWVDQMPEYRLANYTFRGVHLEADILKDYGAIVMTPSDYNEKFEAEIIPYKNSSPAYYVIK